MKNLPVFICLMLLIACRENIVEKKEWQAVSPDGKLQLTIALRSDGTTEEEVLQYRLVRSEGGQTVEVLAWSPLGIDREDESFYSGLRFSAENSRPVTDEYTMLRGKQQNIRDSGSELTLGFRNANDAQLEVIFRIYDDGMAYRYRFPGPGGVAARVVREYSGFRVPGGRGWLQPYDEITQYTPAYERYFENGIPVGTAAPGKEGWCFPALFQHGEQWILLSEAALDTTYSGSHLQPEAPGGLYTIRFPESEEAMGIGESEPLSVLPWQTPWRVVITGNALAPVIESTLITSLSPPSELSDISWIQPGRSSWSWWSDHPSSRDFGKLKAFVDLASDMGWEYSLVDANWNTMEGGNIEELIQYANAKGVGVLMWYNSGGPHNTVTEQPRDRMLDPQVRRAEMAKLEQWGVKGIKVDFFQSDKQEVIKQYFGILRDAADYHLLVNFHGCTIPRGWDRTFPHLLTMESVRGGEAYSFDATFPENAPAQNTIYAATRNVIGPMDYTPVTFSDNEYPHITTNAHELALAIVFESGILHLADRVSAYTNASPAVRSFLEEVPVTWGETRFLGGTPGEDFLIARRQGADGWYIAGINGENEAKSFNVDLSFVGSGQCLLFKDGANAREILTEEFVVGELPVREVEIAPYGGFMIVFNP